MPEMTFFQNILTSIPRYFYSWNHKCRLAIIDDSIPKSNPCGFRNYEFNLILKSMPDANIWTMSKTSPGPDAWFNHPYGQTYSEWKNNKKAYLSKVPQNKNRIFWLNTNKSYSFNLAYSIFFQSLLGYLYL